MIVRILSEGQYEVPDEQLTAMNALDEEVEAAIEAGDEVTFTNTLAALLDGVRKSGTVLPDDLLHDSDLILPPSDASLEEVKALLSDDGLIPG